MDSLVEIYLDRATNELLAADSLRKLSEEKAAKEGFLLPKDTTFYSSVISHSYYAIFYAAKAALLSKEVKTDSPEVHKKTYEEFSKVFVESHLLDKHLFEIYQDLLIQASDLLDIFREEKQKRGHFTYQTLPQANKAPAHESLINAKLFVSSIRKVLQ